MSEVKLLELPEPWQCETAMCPALYTPAQMHAYARAHLAEREREVERLRLRLHRIETGLTEQIAFHVEQVEEAEARAERLAEALHGLKDLMLRQAKWEPCDCGCPQQRTPDGPHSVTWLRAAQQVEIAISKSNAEGR